MTFKCFYTDQAYVYPNRMTVSRNEVEHLETKRIY